MYLFECHSNKDDSILGLHWGPLFWRHAIYSMNSRLDGWRPEPILATHVEPQVEFLSWGKVSGLWPEEPNITYSVGLRV